MGTWCRSAMLVGGAAWATAVACRPARQYIHYDAQHNLITAKPPYVTTGDSLFLVIHDTLYKNLYAPQVGSADVVVGERTPVYGGADLAKLAAGFPAQVLAVHAKQNPTGAAYQEFLSSSLAGFAQHETVESLLESRTQPSVADAVLALRSMVTERDQLVASACNAAIDDASRYFLTRPDQSALLAFLADAHVRDRARRLAGRASPGDSPPGESTPRERRDEEEVTRLSDTLDVRSLRADEIDTLVAHGGRYARQASAFALLFGADPAAFAADPAGLDKQLTALHGCVEARRRTAPAVAALQVKIKALAGTPGMPAGDVRDAVITPPIEPLRLAGVDVDALVERDSATAAAIQNLYGDLSTIARKARRVAAAMNTAPAYSTWVRCEAALPSGGAGDSVCGPTRRRVTRDTVLYVGNFWKPVQVQVTPVRGDRFAPFASPPTVTFARPGTPAAPGADSAARTAAAAGGVGGGGNAILAVAAADANGGGGGGKGGGKQGGAKAGGGGGSQDSMGGDEGGADGGDTKGGGTTAAEKKGDTKGAAVAGADKDVTVATIPTAAVDVLERYRFQVGFGYGRSSLTTFVYDTKEDTVNGVPGTDVRVTGRSPTQYFPVATLSYVVLPLRGKVFGAQAYDILAGVTGGTPRERGLRVVGRYLRQAGLAAQLGVSLQDPTKQLFTGVATEPLPGVTVGWGRYLTYVDRSRFTADTFVARVADPTPVQKQWLGEWSAWTASIDGAVILAGFGKLLGLK